MIFLATSLFAKTLSAQDVSGNCSASEPVCAWVQKVVDLKTPNMIASGTMIAPNFILTSHHVVEDHAVIAVRMASGDIRSARPIPHDVPVDLVILRLESTVEEPSPEELISNELALDLKTGTTPILHVVAFDRRRSQTWVNNPRSYANFLTLGSFLRRGCIQMQRHCPEIAVVRLSMRLAGWLVFWQRVASV